MHVDNNAAQPPLSSQKAGATPSLDPSISPEQIEAFAALFRGRDDVWGAVWGQSMKESVTHENYAAHLAGKTSLGIYPLMKDNTCVFAAFDTDTEDFSIPLRIKSRLDQLGVPAYIMRSKSGRYHVYVFFYEPIQASRPRELASRLLADLGISCEIFPKQDILEPGQVGNYINLPFFGDERPALDINRKPITLATFLNEVKVVPIEAVDRAIAQLPPLPYLPPEEVYCLRRNRGDGAVKAQLD